MILCIIKILQTFYHSFMFSFFKCLRWKMMLKCWKRLFWLANGMWSTCLMVLLVLWGLSPSLTRFHPIVLENTLTLNCIGKHINSVKYIFCTKINISLVGLTMCYHVSVARSYGVLRWQQDLLFIHHPPRLEIVVLVETSIVPLSTGPLHRSSFARRLIGWITGRLEQSEGKKSPPPPPPPRRKSQSWLSI